MINTNNNDTMCFQKPTMITRNYIKKKKKPQISSSSIKLSAIYYQDIKSTQQTANCSSYKPPRGIIQNANPEKFSIIALALALAM